MNPVTIMNAPWLEPNVQPKLNVNPMEPLDIGNVHTVILEYFNIKEKALSNFAFLSF